MEHIHPSCIRRRFFVEIMSRTRTVFVTVGETTRRHLVCEVCRVERAERSGAAGRRTREAPRRARHPVPQMQNALLLVQVRAKRAKHTTDGLFIVIAQFSASCAPPFPRKAEQGTLMVAKPDAAYIRRQFLLPRFERY